ncbi:MAG: cysteine desulfurase family protein [Fibrobacterota bacterium]
MKKIYLDNNATTMCDPEAAAESAQFLGEIYGNPSSLHNFGIEAMRKVREYYDTLYEAFNASDSDDIIVNSCGTESNNTVLKTVYDTFIRTGKRRKIITTNVEHPAINEPLEYLKELGAEPVFLPVDKNGAVSAEQAAEAIDTDTALVSVMWANNETGVIMPVEEILEICRSRDVLFHTDATQAVGKIKMDLTKFKPDYLTFSAHKFHGPKGVGGLFIKNGAPARPLLYGGEQMRRLRAGTVNTLGIAGMAIAAKKAADSLEFEQTEVRRMRDRLEAGLLEIPDTVLNGHPENRVPNTANISFLHIEGEAMLWDLNENGIAASTGSACSSEELAPSSVLSNMGSDPERTHTALRFSLSRFNTMEEIEYTVNTVKKIVNRLRTISGRKG